MGLFKLSKHGSLIDCLAHQIMQFSQVIVLTIKIAHFPNFDILPSVAMLPKFYERTKSFHTRTSRFFKRAPGS